MDTSPKDRRRKFIDYADNSLRDSMSANESELVKYTISPTHVKHLGKMRAENQLIDYRRNVKKQSKKLQAEMQAEQQRQLRPRRIANDDTPSEIGR